MQKVIVGMGLAWLLVGLVSISLVYAQAATPTGAVQESTQLGRDLFLTIGFDMWPNQWQTFIQRGSEILTFTDFSVGFIPTVTLTYKNFFISGSYMATPEYDFGEVTRFDIEVDTELFGSPEDPLFFPVFQEIGVKASRQEVDLTLGYFPLNWLGVAIGYKGVFQDFEIESRSIRLPPSPFVPVAAQGKGESIFRYQGPIFGVLGSARITDSFALLGNAFGGYMFTSCTPGTCGSAASGTYAGSKIVLRYAPTTLPQLSLTLGYRVQVINTEIDGLDSNGIDLTHGPVFGVNYRF